MRRKGTESREKECREREYKKRNTKEMGKGKRLRRRMEEKGGGGKRRKGEGGGDEELEGWERKVQEREKRNGRGMRK